MTLSTIGQHSWPPNNGYTISWWMYVDNFGTSDSQFDLFTFLTDDKQVISKLFIFEHKLHFQSAPKSVTEFSSYPFEEKKWYHIGLSHSRHRFQVCSVSVYQLLINIY